MYIFQNNMWKRKSPPMIYFCSSAIFDYLGGQMGDKTFTVTPLSSKAIRQRTETLPEIKEDEIWARSQSGFTRTIRCGLCGTNIQLIAVVPSAMRNVDVSWNAPAKVKQCMHLHASLAVFPQSLCGQFDAGGYGGGVQSILKSKNQRPLWNPY